MKRDMDYVREILLKIEGVEEGDCDSGQLLSDVPTQLEEDRLDEHLRMLVKDAGLLDGIPYEHTDGVAWCNLRLTWRGHEYLDTVRDDEIWAKTKAGAARVGDFSLDLLKAWRRAM